MKRHRIPRYLFTTLLTLVMAIGIMTGPGLVSHMAAQDTATPEMGKVEVVEQVSPSVVTVYNISDAPTLFDQQTNPQPRVQGAGTGFIIDTDGHIVTNWHVVQGGDEFGVELYDGTQIDAELVGTDPRDDLALVKIDPSDVPATVAFGESTRLKPGEDVLAIGNPLAQFGNTVTAGIVSGLGRGSQFVNPDQASVCQQYSNLIQHDAAINPGNSGGPLFNMQGEVIGVNTLGIPLDQNQQPVQGLFFAVPSQIVKLAVEQMKATGTVSRATIGITGYDVNPALANQYDLPVDDGFIVTDIPGDSPAMDAGLQVEDIITAVDGNEVTLDQPLSATMVTHQPGDTVTLMINRDGNESQVDVTLSESEIDFSQCTIQPGQ